MEPIRFVPQSSFNRAALPYLCLALLFAYLFARTGRLWPLIVAHALTDILSLAAAM